MGEMRMVMLESLDPENSQGRAVCAIAMLLKLTALVALVLSLLDMLASFLLIFGSRFLKPELLVPWIILAVITLVFYLVHITALLMVNSFIRMILYVFFILCKSYLVICSNLLQNQLKSFRRVEEKS